MCGRFQASRAPAEVARRDTTRSPNGRRHVRSRAPARRSERTWQSTAFQIFFKRLGGVPDPADGRRQAIARDREFPRPVVDLVLLLEADEFIVLGRVLRVVGHDVHPSAGLLVPTRLPREASAVGNATWGDEVVARRW